MIHTQGLDAECDPYIGFGSMLEEQKRLRFLELQVKTFLEQVPFDGNI